MSIKNKKYILSVIVVAVLIVLYLVFQDKIDAILNEGQGNESNQTVIVDGTGQNAGSQDSGNTAADNQTAAGNSDGTADAQNPGTTTSDNSSDNGSVTDTPADYVTYKFRSKKLLDQHYEKHGKEMGFASAADYEKAASDVVNNPDALNKIEKEDGDYVYYVEATNEFVIVSTDGYIRTYFLPSAGKSYYDRQ
ncbi:MAG: hypothetical protein J5728_08345 [Lachnospiraceae bacterium]|nr:hypothetical protein [Lachnospiraceae bacterium]